MEIDENSIKRLDATNFPHGYILIYSFNPQEKNPAFWGEISLLKANSKLRMCFMLDGLSLKETKYHLSLYTDRSFEYCFLSFNIDFKYEDPRLIGIHIIEQIEETGAIPSEFFNLMHMITYATILYLPVVYASRPNDDPRMLLGIGYHFSFKENFASYVEDQLKIPLENIISEVDTILG